MGELQPISTGVIQPKPIKRGAKAVYQMLKHHVENKTILSLHEVCDVYADHNIPAQALRSVGMYGDSGKWEIRQVNSREWFKNNYLNVSSYRGLAIQWLKYHIGNLVLNGYAVLIPVMNLEPQQENKIQTK